jgi:hypothetical protein
MEGSQVTTVVSVVGGVVGFVALTVAWSQMRIASAKTRLDLYNKRFEIYVSALEYHKAAWDGTHVEIKLAGHVFIKSFRESQFLFKPADGIYDVLKAMLQNGSTIRHHKQMEYGFHNGIEHDEDALKSLHAASIKARDEFGDHLKALEVKLGKYLSFHNVRGWTIF